MIGDQLFVTSKYSASDFGIKLGDLMGTNGSSWEWGR